MTKRRVGDMRMSEYLLTLFVILPLTPELDPGFLLFIKAPMRFRLEIDMQALNGCRVVKCSGHFFFKEVVNEKNDVVLGAMGCHLFFGRGGSRTN